MKKNKEMIVILSSSITTADIIQTITNQAGCQSAKLFIKHNWLLAQGNQINNVKHFISVFDIHPYPHPYPYPIIHIDVVIITGANCQKKNKERSGETAYRALASLIIIVLKVFT